MKILKDIARLGFFCVFLSLWNTQTLSAILGFAGQIKVIHFLHVEILEMSPVFKHYSFDSKLSATDIKGKKWESLIIRFISPFTFPTKFLGN